MKLAVKILRNFLIVSFLIFTVFYFYQYVKSYDTITHSGLSGEIVDFYNLSFDKKLNGQQKELIVRGSVEEDSPATRVINHFYDPVRNIGLLDGHSAKNWAISDSLQKYSLVGGGDYSWPKILKDYAEGNEERAFIGLGHILHLIEDMAVPDHTRNDSHLKLNILGFVVDLNTNPSPYEDWAKEKTIDTISNLDKPKLFSNLGDYFDFMASYSNNNFFSKDTITGDKYSNYKYENPKIIEFDDNYGYGLDNLNGDKFKIIISFTEKSGERVLYLRDDKDTSVFQEYFSRLSKQAILTGAGVIDLFFKEAEAAKQEYLRQQKIKQEQEAQKNLELSNYLNSANFFQLVSSGFKYAFVEPVINPVKTGYATTKNSFVYGAATIGQTTSNVSSMAAFTSKNLASLTGIFVEEKVQETKENVQQFFGSGITFIQKSISGSLSLRDISRRETTSREEVEPSAPIPTEIISLQLVSASPIVVEETASEIPPPIELSEVEPPKVEIPWWKELGYEHPGQLPGQAVSIELSPEPPLEETPPPPEETPPPPPEDTTPPTVSLEIENYNLMSTSLDLIWNSSDEDLDFYDLEFQKNSDDWQELEYKTQETNLNFTADDFSTYKFRIKATDLVGNESEWSETEISLEISTQPVVINEIAWMGTQANAADEWIELYNNSNQDIDLTGWSLVSPDESPNIVLSGVIKAKSYFLLERTDDKPTSESADWFFTGALNNRNDNQTEEERKEKEGLTLKNNEQIIDQVSLWYAGRNISGLPKLSMERISALRDGDDINNWKNNDQLTFNGKDIGNGVIYGTPKQKNSLIININDTYSRNVIFYPYPEVVYLVDHFTLNSGSTLTIEPGAVIKMGYQYGWVHGSMKIKGDVNAQGLPDKKIYITSERDNRWEGDRGVNAGSGIDPQLGDWHSIHFLDSQNSVLKNVEISYAGRNAGGCCWWSMLYPAVLLENSQVTLENVLIEQTNNAGIRLIGESFLNISDSQIKNIMGDAIAFGELFKSTGKSGAEILNNIFENNSSGIIDYGREYPSPLLKIVGNTFTATPNPMRLSLNSPLENYDNLIDQGVIELSGNIIEGDERVIYKDSAPYVTGGIIVDAGFLKIDPGVILKFTETWSGILVQNGGSLEAIGFDADKIYFTSDQENPQPRDWRGIKFVNAQDSQIDYAIVQYAGDIFTLCCWETYYFGGITIDGDSDDSSGLIEISNSEIDSNYYAGILVKNSGRLDISNSEIKNHTLPADGSYGIRSEGENEVEIGEGVIFLNNFQDTYGL